MKLVQVGVVPIKEEEGMIIKFWEQNCFGGGACVDLVRSLNFIIDNKSTKLFSRKERALINEMGLIRPFIMATEVAFCFQTFLICY